MFYVEPTTGAVYPSSSAPYFTVEGLFNNKNYWANIQRNEKQQRQLQTDSCAGGVIQEETRKMGRWKGGTGSGDRGEGEKSMDSTRRSGEGSPALSFDLLDSNLWEFVFIDPMREVSERAGVVVYLKAPLHGSDPIVLFRPGVALRVVGHLNATVTACCMAPSVTGYGPCFARNRR